MLVEPGDSLNVGSVARAMMNLGFAHLHLVAPPRYKPEQAAVSACWATPLLEQAEFHADLDEALAPMQHVVGFSARHGRDRPRHLLLHDWCVQVTAALPERVALLFGSEDHGLEREHVARCHGLVRIPSTAENPSFNLSQAVLLALFELSRQGWDAATVPEPPPAALGEVQQLERLVDQVMRQVGFYGPGTPRPIPAMVHHLLKRTAPDDRELGILLGMFGKIHRALAGRIPIHPAQSENEG